MVFAALFGALRLRFASVHSNLVTLRWRFAGICSTLPGFTLRLITITWLLGF